MATTYPRIARKTRVRISKSGQITLPAATRRVLGVEPGDQIDVVETRDGTVNLQVVKPLLVDEFAGILGPPPGGKTLMEYIDQIDREPKVRRAYMADRASHDSD